MLLYRRSYVQEGLEIVTGVELLRGNDYYRTVIVVVVTRVCCNKVGRCAAGNCILVWAVDSCV